MKGNLLIACLVAVAIHAFLFALPLHRAGKRAPAPVTPPMSLAVMSTEIPVAASPVVRIPAETPEKPSLAPKKKPSEKEILHPGKGALPERTTVAIPVAGPAISQAEPAPNAAKSSANRMAVGTGPRPGESITDSQHHVATLGHQQGEDLIEYAKPKYKENPLPHYPRVARRRGYEGQTVLRVEVLQNGKVGQIEMATSSGFEVLDEAALRSVRNWTFVPGTKNGTRIDQWVMVPVTFSLK
jgi:protein TonB